MKSGIFIGLVLVLSLIVADTTLNRRQTSTIFKNLMNNELGKDIYTSIELELQTGNENNIVDTILNMLYGLRDQFTEATSDSETELLEKQEFCGEKITGLEIEIQNLDERIGKSKAQVPVLEEAADIKNVEAGEKQQEVDSQNQILSELYEKDSTAQQTFLDSVQEHDDMIEALQKAKQLIAQLSATGFLQKSQGSKNAFAQLKSHQIKTLAQLPNHQHRGVFKLLIDLAQDVGVQADQAQVADIIAIIDELINHERETAAVEFQVEQKRQERFNFDLSRATAASEQLDASIKDLQADAHTLNLKVKELNQDIKGWEESRQAKQEQLDLQTKTCNDTEQSISSSLESNAETLALIQQVIEIFESEDIQTIKHVVSDIEQ